MRERSCRRDVTGFEEAGSKAADVLRSSSSVLIVGHIDADGITASSIASMALGRAAIGHTVLFAKKLDDAIIHEALSRPVDKVWFVDLGSAVVSKLEKGRCVISDHHRPDPSVGEKGLDEGHVNPHPFGIDGSTEVSGAGVTYLIAKKMDHMNRDLSPLAVVGAVGDFQEASKGRLVGYNRTILDDAASTGLLRTEKDVRLFGRETRPLPAFLQHSNDPALLPLISHHKKGGAGDQLNEDQLVLDEDYMDCIDFIRGTGVEPCADGTIRTWNQMTREEKGRIVSALVNRILDSGRGLPVVQRLIGETYSLSPDLPGTPPGWSLALATGTNDRGEAITLDQRARAVLDAKEFATLLNACGRHDRPELGKAICMGERGEGLMEAVRQQEDHRQSLRKAIEMVRNDPRSSISTLNGEGRALNAIRFFHAKDRVQDTILGTVVGILIGIPDIPSDRPLIGLAQSSDGTCTIKVSGRGTVALTAQGLDLAAAMRRAAEVVGGAGGGHNIAAGATIPEGKEMEFLDVIDRLILEQLSP